MLFPGATVGALYTLSDLFVTLGERMDAAGAGRTYTYLYWGELDDLAHRYGPYSERYRRELSDFALQFSLFLREQAGRRRGDTLFLLTADHGHIATPPDPALELRHYAEIQNCLSILPSGEARLPYIYLRPGQEERFRELAQQAWPGRFKFLRGADCLQAGLFGAGGALHPRITERIGDLVLVPQAHGDYLHFDLQRPNLLRGRHGGLSRAEMLVPLLVIDEL
jgi:predicted AlkP superfamily pyrophosphatase or phosphodiesterase